MTASRVSLAGPATRHACPVYLLSESVAGLSHASRRRVEALGLETRSLEALPRDCVFLATSGDGKELELRSGDQPRLRGVAVRVRVPAPRARLTRRQPLARAIGPGRRRILDATAGFGDDAVRLADFGHRIVAVEREGVVATLLEDAIERARDAGADARLADLASRLDVRHGDARDVIPGLEPPAEVVYLDPMFPLKSGGSGKTALPPRAIQLLRRLAVEDPEPEALLAVALAHCHERVVVKRPIRAEPLAASPTASYSGKLVRYDVYRREPRPGDAQGPNARGHR